MLAAAGFFLNGAHSGRINAITNYLKLKNHQFLDILQQTCEVWRNCTSLNENRAYPPHPFSLDLPLPPVSSILLTPRVSKKISRSNTFLHVPHSNFSETTSRYRLPSPKHSKITALLPPPPPLGNLWKPLVSSPSPPRSNIPRRIVQNIIHKTEWNVNLYKIYGTWPAPYDKGDLRSAKLKCIIPVSYTHLTLPTIYSV